MNSFLLANLCLLVIILIFSNPPFYIFYNYHLVVFYASLNIKKTGHIRSVFLPHHRDNVRFTSYWNILCCSGHILIMISPSLQSQGQRVSQPRLSNPSTCAVPSCFHFRFADHFSARACRSSRNF